MKRWLHTAGLSMPRRRALSLIAGGAWLGAAATAVALQRRTLRFPDDFGAHPEARTEWWYLTGSLGAANAAGDAPSFGFQITFFRSRVDANADHPSRFAARQLIFAHAAVTDLAARRLRHDQRIARAGFGIAEAATGDTAVTLHGWRLTRNGAVAPANTSLYHAVASSETAGFSLDLTLRATQPMLLQGDAGWSRKGPLPEQASQYYSQPQLALQGRLRLDGRDIDVRGGAWFDHEWSDTLLDPQAVGWDWIGMNLLDGSALTAFVLRRADGSALWAGGSLRSAGGAVRSFGADEVRFEAGRRWTSASTRASYPVQWRIDTPAGRFEVVALLDNQELDSRGNTGAVYWEGLSELRDEHSRVVGRGYLEMTGYVKRLTL